MPERHRHVPFDPEGDVGEVLAGCPRCDARRVFVKGYGDFADLEERAAAPSVQRALAGEPGWLCRACGSFRRDVVEERAYPVAFANVGAVRTEREELPTGGEGVTEDLQVRAAVGPGAVLHEPSTEEEALRAAEPEDTLLQEAALGDRALDQAILHEVGRQERGEEDLDLPTGPRTEMPPPERLPSRDRTEERTRGPRARAEERQRLKAAHEGRDPVL